MIILDSDIVIDFLRQHPPAVAWIGSVQDTVCLPGIVSLELHQGCRNKQEAQLLARQLKPFSVLWPNDIAAHAALANFISGHLTHSLGILDSLIAATAVTHRQPLYTFNQKHFAAVSNLVTVQPYVR